MLGFIPVSSDSLSGVPQANVVIVGTGVLSLPGQSVSMQTVFPLGVGSFALTGYAVDSVRGIPVGNTSLSVSGLAGTLATSFAIPKGTLTLIGYAPTTAKTIPIGVGALTLTTYSVVAGKLIPVGVGTITLVGYEPGKRFGIQIPTIALSTVGYKPTTSRSDSVSIDNAELLLVGEEASFGILFGMGGAITHTLFSTYAPKLRFGKIDIEKKERDSQALISFGIQRTGATWIDVNSRYKQNKKPLTLTNVAAINNSLYNLFQCPIGARGRIMQPRYGTFIYNLLQEPTDAVTANRIRATLIQTIEEWEPRIQLDYANTFVVADSLRVGYTVQVKYVYRATGEPSVADFFISP